MVCCWWQMVWHSTYGQVQGGNGKWGGPHVIFEIWNLREWGFSLPFLCHLKPKNVLNLSCRMTFPFLPFNIILHFLLPLSLTFFFLRLLDSLPFLELIILWEVYSHVLACIFLSACLSLYSWTHTPWCSDSTEWVGTSYVGDSLPSCLPVWPVESSLGHKLAWHHRKMCPVCLNVTVPK